MLEKSVKKKDIARALAVQHHLTEEQANHLLTDVLDMIWTLLLKKNKVCLYRFGSFFLKKKNSRSMSNPRTGEAMLVPERTVMCFRPSRKFNKRLRMPSDTGVL